MKIKKSETEVLKSYIIEAFLLLLKQKNYTDITIKEITTKAGVNRSTYYRNFNSKEDIIKAFYKTLLEQSISTQSQNLESHLLHIFNQYLLYKKELLCLHEHHLSYHLLNVLNTYFSDFVRFKNQNSLEDNFEVFYHTGGIFNIFMLWFAYRMELSPIVLVHKSMHILPSDFKPLLIHHNN